MVDKLSVHVLTARRKLQMTLTDRNIFYFFTRWLHYFFFFDTFEYKMNDIVFVLMLT